MRNQLPQNRSLAISTRSVLLNGFTRIVLLWLFLCSTSLLAEAQQPANDNCSNASIINISGNGFDLGAFRSASTDITSASLQTGEYFAPAIFTAGQDQKSLWYKFTLPTTRNVKVTLLQPGNSIPAGDAGFAVYKTSTCLPGSGQVSTKFTPIAKFGSSQHPCVDPGDYYIQVSSKSTSKGNLFIQLDISDATGAQYDHPADAFSFGTIGNSMSRSDYFIECQSIEDASETCTALANHKEYTKSTWHTFTTPAYFDYVSVMLASKDCHFTNGMQTFGYTLYKGDVTKTSYKTLTPVSACDSLQSDGYYAGYKVYKCNELQPNTTYSVQIFYHEDFKDWFRLSVGAAGLQATQAPEPILSKLPASNKLGKLNGDNYGITTYATDYFGCNSRHSLHPCSPSLPSNGISFNGINYTLSTFFTFQLTTSANISFSAGTNNCGGALLLSLYNQNLTNDCTGLDTANLVSRTASSSSATCLDAGIYTLQISGTDTALLYYYYNCGSDINCLLSNFAQQISLSINVKYVNAGNLFSLNKSGAFDGLNKTGGVMKPLQNGTLYTSVSDTFGCANTVLPPTYSGDYCNLNTTKAMYREFVIGDADNDSKADSGVVRFSNLYGYNNGTYMATVLYKGDANALAAAQNAHSYGQTIGNLTPFSECFQNYSCYGQQVCVTPGTYTLVTMGDQNHVGTAVQPAVEFDLISTLHGSGQTAQDMGNILDTLGGEGGTLTSDADYFSCTDNAVTINGYAPPNINGHAATKAIYRQFYLSAPSIVTICGTSYNGCNYATGPATLFAGKASDGLNKLTLVQSTSSLYYYSCISRANCDPLPAGWYTVVTYGSGPTYDRPFQNLNENGSYGSSVGMISQITISVTKACPGPQFNRPYKAAIDTLTRQPFLLEWKLRSGSTAAYPKTDTTYTLYNEHFNCTLDTPFTIVKPCDEGANRVAYYVFKINKESYVEINTQNLAGEVFSGDVRKDSATFKMADPIQPCLTSAGYIQLCRLQPGTYTLLLFAGDNHVYNGCGSVEPTIYIDNIGYSRFDHAKNAYDFGIIPSDSLYYSGKPGDKNPLDAARAASNDFIYCTTGSQTSDPTESVCSSDYNPNIYNTRINNHLYDSSFLPTPWNQSRRNLWYTFVVDQPGTVHVKVNNKTQPDFHPAFAIYESDVNGTLPFATVVSSGQVDSTKEQGLKLVDYNLKYGYYYYCYNAAEEITFYRDPCQPTGPTRYYILVDNPNSYPYYLPGLKPNSQFEVSIMLDTVNAIETKFDHYYQAYNIGTVGAGTYQGATDNFTCATADATDPESGYQYCASKTLWYKFTATVTGNVKFRYYIDSLQQDYSPGDLQLFRENVAGDSTSKGLSYISSTYYYDYTTGKYSGGNCVSPGTYYLIFTGCNRHNEFVFPEIEIIEEAGDFCSAPVKAAINGPGSDTASVMVDCHTIGNDYGEFSTELSCPVNAKTQDYKTSWFRLDVSGKDTLDVTVYLEQHTNANSDAIKYRMMTGDCGAMQEQSCVEDSRTKNTYRCLVPGKSYYIQVFTPVLYNYYLPVTGNIDLIVSSVAHTDTCAPDANCLAIAKFIPQFDCTTDDSVKFVNYSTYGSDIEYKWDFGYNGKTATAVSPSFYYPATATDKKYNVTLSLLNKSCNGQDSIVVPVTIPGRPHVDLGNDFTACSYDTSITLHATSFKGTTYSWFDGSTDSVYNVIYKGNNQVYVAATYNNCSSRDTVNIYINPVYKQEAQNSIVCPGDSVQLYGGYFYNTTYTWNTGETEYYIYAKQADTYWVDIENNGCIVRDSFVVSTISNAQPLGADTTLCFGATNPSYLLDATVAGAGWYQWQDGQGGEQYTVTNAGTYWVEVHFNNCVLRDSVEIISGAPPEPLITGPTQLCTGDTLRLDAGGLYQSYLWNTGETTQAIGITTAGDYSVTVTENNGCSNTSAVVQITENALPVPHITGNNLLCGVTETTLSVSENYATYLWSNGAATQSTTTSAPGALHVTVTDVNGCLGTDSVMVISGTEPLAKSLSAALCGGASYTLPSGKQVNEAGVYSDTLRSTAGCDSLVTTITLSVLSPVVVTVQASICEGASYTLPDGSMVTEANIYTDTLRSTAGCDSIIHTTNLKVFSPQVLHASAAICAGSVYTLPTGETVSEAGTYSDTLRSSAGCDSIIRTVALTVFEPVWADVSASVCAGQWYTAPSGKTYSLAGDYNDTLHSVSGCDSLMTRIHLSLLTAQTASQSAAICAKDYFTLPSGTKVNQSGIYTDTLRSTSGCDSLITTTQLMVKEATLRTDAATICQGAMYWLPSGKAVSKAGSYVDTLHDNSGCDSLVITTQLTVTNIIKQQTTASFCAGSTYALPWGITVSAPGVYADTLRTVLGCDSLISSVNLTAFAILNRTASASICPGQTYLLPSGKAVSEAGVYSDTLRSTAGCDSIITQVSLAVTTAPLVQSISESICNGESYTLPSGKKIYSAGTYRDTIASHGGCDSLISVVTLSVQPKPVFTIQPLSASLCAGDSVSISATGGNTYEWYAGNTLTGETGQNILIRPVQSVVYTVVVTDNTCKDSLFSLITVHPVPTLSLSKSGDINCAVGTVHLTASGAAQYTWSPAGTLTGSQTPSPSATPLATTVYHVEAASEWGCVAIDSIEVKVTEGNEGGYTLPSAFTPNGDGRNDCFGVSSWGAVTNLHFSVFDRTGRLLFSTTNPAECWNGTWNGQPMQSGTYVYQASGNTNCGFVYRKSTVVLIR